ncbi:MAG: 4Fe-4S single cluster domain-containing protein [Fimbriiglobus sp.]
MKPLELVSSATVARIAQVVPRTEAEGPGLRFAVWFQGCPLRCPGCCNPEFLPFRGGLERSVEELCAQYAQTEGLEGLSLLGGEPFAHAEAGVMLARTARDRGQTVMIYSGYTLEQLRLSPDPAVHELLALTDLLVDGPYNREQPDTARRWIGSTNQRIHFLSDRYQADDPCWKAKNTLEVRVSGSEITINGFPALGAVGLWKGWKRKKSEAKP